MCTCGAEWLPRFCTESTLLFHSEWGPQILSLANKGFCNLAIPYFSNLTSSLFLPSSLHSSYAEHPPILGSLHLWSSSQPGMFFSQRTSVGSLPLCVYVSSPIREIYPESTFKTSPATPPASKGASSFLIMPIISLVLAYCLSSLKECLHRKSRGFVLWTPHPQ